MPSVVRTTSPGSNGTHSPASCLAIFWPLRIIKRPLPSDSVRLSASSILSPGLRAHVPRPDFRLHLSDFAAEHDLKQFACSRVCKTIEGSRFLVVHNTAGRTSENPETSSSNKITLRNAVSSRSRRFADSLSPSPFFAFADGGMLSPAWHDMKLQIRLGDFVVDAAFGLAPANLDLLS